MLLHGLPAEEDTSDAAYATDPSATPQQRACMHIGRLMELLLPAIDANDETKLDSALSFFNAVLCSTVKLCSATATDASVATAASVGLPLGIDLRSWAVELVERLFEVAVTLHGTREASGHADDACAPHMHAFHAFAWQRWCRWTLSWDTCSAAVWWVSTSAMHATAMRVICAMHASAMRLICAIAARALQGRSASVT